MKKTFLIPVIILYLFFKASTVAAYDSDLVHRNINENATHQSLVDQYMQQYLGYTNGYLTEFNGNRVIYWIMEGGHDEDNGTRSRNHFHDPLQPFEEAGFNLRILGIPIRTFTSSLVWAQTTDSNETTGNAATWHSARQHFFHALTTGSEQSYANMFLTLGQLTHLISDKAVPAHVRDDNHMYEAIASTVFVMQHIEYWAARHAGNLPYDNGVRPEAAIFSNYNPTELAPVPIARLWDTDQYSGNNPEVTLSNNIGLAEFTNANFLSEGTVFNSYPHPNTDNLTLQPTQIPDPFNPGSEVTRMYWTREEEGNIPRYRVAGENYLRISREELYPEMGEDFEEFPPLDRNVFEDYTGILIPRAVGYSTALLNYFIRGTLEITPPSEYVYSLIDENNTQEFTQISANVRNTSAITDGLGNIIDEVMGEGELFAVAKYRVIPGYAADLSTYPANSEELENLMTVGQNPTTNQPIFVDYSYSISEPINIRLDNNNLILTDIPTEFTFTFTDENTIPIGITDLYLQIVFRGTLGDERDEAIVVGMVDLNEPSHIVFCNSTDQIVVNGELMTSNDVRNTPALAEMADWNLNEVFNEVVIDENGTNIGEPFIDPYDLSIQFGFSQTDPETTQVEPEYIISINTLHSGRYSKFIVLTDADEVDGYWLSLQVQRHFGAEIETDSYSGNLGGVYLQEGNPWQYTPLEPIDYLHRQVRQNRLVGEFSFLGTPSPYLGDQRAVYENLTPFPIEFFP